MSNELQDQLTLLAEKIGHEVSQISRQLVAWDGLSYVDEELGSEYAEFPGADGTLTDDETAVVLDWLDKADYKTTGDEAGFEIQEFKPHPFPFGRLGGEFHTVASGEGDTLSVAVAAALLTLELPVNEPAEADESDE